MAIETDPAPQTDQPELRRDITLTLLVLYGLGVTIGAGIYVLVGATAARAGIYAPTAFLVAALVMFFSACSFGELSCRYPQSAGEAAYVEAGFGRASLTLITGTLLLAGAIISSAAIALGCAGYLAQLTPLPGWALIIMVVIASGMLASWGILESVLVASVLTLIEIAGLLAVVVAGFWFQPEIVTRLPELIPPLGDTAAFPAIFSGSLVAFFAFIGFDGMVNIVEETEDPARNMPLGIFITLLIATLLYFAVCAIAVLALPIEELAESAAPLSLLFERVTGMTPVIITLIAIGATSNGVVIQIILSARVLYGMANVGRLPKVLGKVNALTRTPLLSTVLVSVSILIFALYLPIGTLAERTTQTVLVVFALVNAALIRIKLRGDLMAEDGFRVPLVIPIIGLLTCLGMLLGPFVSAM